LALSAGRAASGKPRAIVSWSSGKDSAFTLHVLAQAREFEIIALFTTLSRVHDRVAMHAVRRELLRAQCESVGLPLWEVEIPSPCSNSEYEDAMRGLVARALAEGVEVVAFGDLFLADIRAYREERLAGTGLRPIFPLWQIPTPELALRMLDAGVSAILTAVDPRKLPAEQAGRVWDHAFLAELPSDVDPCGENGEFHTFVTRGPMLRTSLIVDVGPRVERDGFVFSDVRLRG
jgi:uncharacterized protein (TIGR00290 family)